MTNEEITEQIKSYIDDIEDLIQNHNLKLNDKQHLIRALDTYNSMYSDVLSGKLDADLVHENITSFLYMLQ